MRNETIAIHAGYDPDPATKAVAVPMRHLGERLEIADVARRIADAFAEHRLGLVVDQGLDRVGAVGSGEAHGEALLRQDVREQRVGRAVELRDGDDVAAAIGEIDQ